MVQWILYWKFKTAEKKKYFTKCALEYVCVSSLSSVVLISLGILLLCVDKNKYKK